MKYETYDDVLFSNILNKYHTYDLWIQYLVVE